MYSFSNFNNVSAKPSSLYVATSEAFAVSCYLEQENQMLDKMKKQAREIFDKYGLKGFSDVPKLQEKLHAVEAELTQEQEQAEQYITEVNKAKEQVENTLVG